MASPATSGQMRPSSRSRPACTVEGRSSASTSPTRVGRRPGTGER
jgi:hypothetical protein